MTLQSDFEAAGLEYARRLTEQREAERLAVLATETRHSDNATAFAEAFGAALDSTTAPPDPGPSADDLMAAIAADTDKENTP